MRNSEASRKTAFPVLGACLLLCIGLGLSRLPHGSPDAVVAPPAPATANNSPRPRVSRSKLGIHFIGRYTNAGRRIITAGPRVIKVLDPQANGDMLAAMRDYKHRFPGGLVVARVWEGTPGVHYEVTDDPAVAADDFWRRVLQPALDRMTPADRKLIDFLEGPNEGETTPTWKNVRTAAWFARFWQRLAERIARAGLRPCIGSIAVGNPPGTPAEIRAKLEAFTPALRAAKRVNGAWSYHAYSLEYTTDRDVEAWYSLRYRLFYRFLRDKHPDLADASLLLTEGGIDRAGDAKKDGWQARGDTRKFERWLEWFDTELQRDDYVLGVTLFQLGDPTGWQSFDLAPVAGWLTEHLKE